MGGNCRRPLRAFILINLIFENVALEEMVVTPKVNRVVFQTFLLTGGESVQCYGRCEKDLKDTSIQTFKMMRCDGRKLRYGCKSGYQINIHLAKLGRLNPYLDICRSKQSFDCAKDATAEVKASCNGKTQCVIDVTNDQRRNACGKIKYISMDIQYICKIRAKLPIAKNLTDEAPTTTRKTTVITTKENTSDKKIVKMIPISTKSYELSTTDMNMSPSSIIVTSRHFTKSDGGQMTYYNNIALQNNKDTKMFWSLTAYKLISDSEFMKNNKIHLAMALVLSMFVGMLMCLCFFFDHCRRLKKKRNTNLNVIAVESNEHIELIPPRIIEAIELRGYFPKQNIVFCEDGGYNTNIEEEANGDEYSTKSEPFLKRNLEQKLLSHSNINPNQNTSFSPSSLTLPQNDILLEIPLSPSPACLQEDKDDDPRLIVRSPSPARIPISAILKQNKTNCDDKCNPELIEIENVYLEEGLDYNDSQYDYVEVEQYHASDEYSSSPQNSCAMAHQRTECYLEPPKVKFVSTTSSPRSNDEVSHEDILVRNSKAKRTRMRKGNLKDRSAYQRSKQLDKTKTDIFFANNGNRYLVRHPREKRIHFVQRYQGAATSSLRGCSQQAIYSDNEDSRRRRQRGLGCNYDRNCREPGTSLCDLHSPMYELSEVYHHNCHSTLSSKCQSLHNEQFGDDHVPLSSSSNKNIKNNEYSIGESGYQSHDTATDSLCSSVFSTDQEDSHMFSPASASVYSACRSKTCDGCTQASKQGSKLFLIRDHNKSKVSLTSQRGDYANPDEHRHGNNSLTDIHPYAGSMCDGDDKEYVQIFRRIPKPNTNHDNLTELEQDANCNCHEIKCKN